MGIVRTTSNSDKPTSAALLGPAAIGVLVVLYIPTIYVVVMSFFDWRPGSESPFVWDFSAMTATSLTGSTSIAPAADCCAIEEPPWRSVLAPIW